MELARAEPSRAFTPATVCTLATLGIANACDTYPPSFSSFFSSTAFFSVLSRTVLLSKSSCVQIFSSARVYDKLRRSLSIVYEKRSIFKTFLRDLQADHMGKIQHSTKVLGGPWISNPWISDLCLQVFLKIHQAASTAEPLQIRLRQEHTYMHLNFGACARCKDLGLAPARMALRDSTVISPSLHRKQCCCWACT